MIGKEACARCRNAGPRGEEGIAENPKDPCFEVCAVGEGFKRTQRLRQSLLSEIFGFSLVCESTRRHGSTTTAAVGSPAVQNLRGQEQGSSLVQGQDVALRSLRSSSGDGRWSEPRALERFQCTPCSFPLSGHARQRRCNHLERCRESALWSYNCRLSNLFHENFPAKCGNSFGGIQFSRCASRNTTGEHHESFQAR